MKKIIIYHREDAAGYCVSNTGWAAGHLAVASWLNRTDLPTFEQYKQECRKYGVYNYNEEFFNSNYSPVAAAA